MAATINTGQGKPFPPCSNLKRLDANSSDIEDAYLHLLFDSIVFVIMETAFDPLSSILVPQFRVCIENTVIFDGEKYERDEDLELEVVGGTSKKSRPTTANSNALKLSSVLLSLFVTEAINRAAIIAEAEGVATVDTTHLERILPQLLLDF